MSAGHSRSIYRQVQTLYAAGTCVGLTDAQLLARFVDGRGADAAFEALVTRHGPMVLGICRDVLRDSHAAEDAFQATFLVLARRARSIWVRDSLGRWLSGVARRVATRARGRDARWAVRGEAASELEPAIGAEDLVERAEVRAAVRAELERLPDRFREPIVLCHLEGLTHEQAADRLRWPVGTVRSRLARGRDKLRGRLERRGLAPAAGPLGFALAAESVQAAVPLALKRGAVKAALAFAAGSGGGGLASIGPGAVPVGVGVLANGVITTMWTTKLAMIGTTVLTGGLLAGGAGVMAFQDGARSGSPSSDARSGVDRAPTADARAGSPEDPKPGELLKRALGDLDPGSALDPPRADASPRELAAQVRVASRLATLAEATPRERIEAEGLLQILKARIEDRHETQVRKLEELIRIQQFHVQALNQAKLELRQATEQVARLERMVNSGDLSPAQLAAERSDLQAKTASVEATQATVEEVQARIEDAERALTLLDELMRDINGVSAENQPTEVPKTSRSATGEQSAVVDPGGNLPATLQAHPGQDGTVTRAYPIGDIILEDCIEMGMNLPQPLGQEYFEPLITLIKTTVALGTWKEAQEEKRQANADQVGWIVPFHANSSLIIRHSPKTQDEIAKLLRLLRRWRHLRTGDMGRSIGEFVTDPE